MGKSEREIGARERERGERPSQHVAFCVVAAHQAALELLQLYELTEGDRLKAEEGEKRAIAALC